MEDAHTEFKREWKSEFVRNVAGLANSDGGVIYVGVSDDGSVYGLKDVVSDLKRIPDDSQNGLGITPKVGHYSKDGKDYITIDVNRSPETLFFKGKVWVKSGSTTRELSGIELRRRLLKDVNLSWSDMTVDNLGIRDLSPEAVMYYIKASGKEHMVSDPPSESDIKNMLSHLGMIGKNDVISRSAVLLFHPRPRDVVYGAHLMIGEFDDKKDLIREEIVDCPLIMMPDMAAEILYDKFIPGIFDYSDMRRKTVYKYPPEAIREILTNAIVHKDYLVGTPVTIKVFSDRISVYNPGPLPDGWDVNDLIIDHPSIPRNRCMAEAFYEAGYIEKWGKGISTVLEQCTLSGIPAPTFTVRQNGLDVEFTGNIPHVPDIADTELTSREMYLLDMIRNGEFTTIKDVSRKMSVSHGTVESTLKSLTEKGMIIRVGSTKSGSWKIQ